MRFDNTAFEFAAGRVGQLPPGDLSEIVFPDRSSVEGSSLVNRLVNRKALARVSATSGKTGTINFYGLAGHRLVDLLGYGYAKISQLEKLRWASLVEGYFSAGCHVGPVMQIVDIRHKPMADNLHMTDLLNAGGFPFVVVMTKGDKLNKGERVAQIQLCDGPFQNREQARRLPSSSTNGEGLGTLKEWITAACTVQE